ncbi:SRPBCC family protein [Nocardioides mangrovi]|uniref:SRPBCC family protein n=1 Tax=Nocardioides mangrovi TaxID=2874580 RepID=A0ABS7UJZ1_9ACTN|nr:SRPBCC family protein [Nocardioides mangrovi]MBZ5741349.1 SRPBCC family protein [Nocardioides mangrovi]
MRRTFDFTGTWEIAAPPSAVHAALVDLERYPEWWPQVVAVASLGPDDARVLCRSALPYTLDLVLHAVSRSADLLEVGLSGDLAGSVRFGLAATDSGTRLDLTQEVSVGGWLGAASYVAGPLLRWNHDRMMRGGIAGLRSRFV